jgi:hypothetical protein
MATYLDIFVIFAIVLLIVENLIVLGYFFHDWKTVESHFKDRKDENIYVPTKEKGKIELQLVLFTAGKIVNLTFLEN